MAESLQKLVVEFTLDLQQKGLATKNTRGYLSFERGIRFSIVPGNIGRLRQLEHELRAYTEGIAHTEFVGSHNGLVEWAIRCYETRHKDQEKAYLAVMQYARKRL